MGTQPSQVQMNQTRASAQVLSVFMIIRGTHTYQGQAEKNGWWYLILVVGSSRPDSSKSQFKLQQARRKEDAPRQRSLSLSGRRHKHRFVDFELSRVGITS